MPALRVGDVTLFESMVICEYLDEVSPPSLHPADPLQRAGNRGWSEFSSELFMGLYRLSAAGTAEEFERESSELGKRLERVEAHLGSGPYFNGPDFALVDAAFAPALMRLGLIEDLHSLRLLERLPKLRRWSDAVLARNSVQASVVPEFPELFRKHLTASGSFLVNQK